MCELFGISSAKELSCNHLLQEFFSHAAEHPDGWGLASFYGNAVSIEKEPVSALESMYLKNRLTDDIAERVLLAHIRKASVGELSYKNSHPFALRDSSGRLWTLIHNGTIFESADLEPYKLRQRGSTDSERILYYLVGQIDARQADKREALSDKERFSVADKMVHTITPNNKVNLLIYDGEFFYIHTNHRDSLHLWEQEKTLVISTKPLEQGQWANVPMNTLLAYRDGQPVYTGRTHANEYIKPEDSEKPPPSG